MLSVDPSDQADGVGGEKSMFNLFKKKSYDYHVYSPIEGTMVPLSEVKDPMFSEKLLGDGCAFHLSDGMIYAPISGTVTAVFPTKHAIGILADSGLEVLIHIGLDSIQLNGEGFMQYVMKDQTVKVGKPIMYVDVDVLKKHNIDPITMLVIPNSKVFTIVDSIETKSVNRKDVLFEVKLASEL